MYNIDNWRITMSKNYKDTISKLDDESLKSLDWFFSDVWAFFEILDKSFLSELKEIEAYLNSELLKRKIDLQRFDMDKIFESIFSEAFSVSCQFHKGKGGCAFLGKSKFDKLDQIKKYLTKWGWNEYSNKEKLSIKNYIVIDCAKEDINYDVIKKYKEMPCIIFNNCETYLENIEIIKMFAYILDEDEYTNDFETLSFYVFLGNKNTIPKTVSEYTDSFCTYVTIYDYDEGKIYKG
jgi:hypothetical protein